jgi:hypothetical protein
LIQGRTPSSPLSGSVLGFPRTEPGKKRTSPLILTLLTLQTL